MHVAHLRNLQPSQDGFSRVHAMAFSPNNKRLAIVDSARNLYMFDEAGERKDKIPLRPAQQQQGTGGGERTFMVRAIAFSHDSARLAVAQSDYIIFIYKVGIEWGDRRSLNSRISQTSGITTMCWPAMSATGIDGIVFGTEKGDVKISLLNRQNKMPTVFTHDSPSTCMACSPDGVQFVTAHSDNTLMRHTFEQEDGAAHSSGAQAGTTKLGTHPSNVTAVALGDYLAVAGSDMKIFLYDRTGNVAHKFDCDPDTDKEITRLVFNSTGQSLAASMWDRLRFYDMNLKTRRWDEGVVVPMKNALALTCLEWKNDGSRVATGTITGAVDFFDTCLRRYTLRNEFEFTFVSHNQVIVKSLQTGARIVVKSTMGYEIQKVNVKQDRYLVANTTNTMLIGDLTTCQLSEIPWTFRGNENFIFDNPQVCMIYQAGELTLVEYGRNEVLGTCRTSHVSSHRISVRIFNPAAKAAALAAAAAAAAESTNAPPPTATSAATAAAAGGGRPASPSSSAHHGPARKAIAYLIDKVTVQVDDLVTGVALCNITHSCKIDWLELNHRATRLLYRDKEHQLMLVDLTDPNGAANKVTLRQFVTYVQWVPESDVVVAQNRNDLCVWYSLDAPDRVGITNIKGGEVISIERGNGKTEVIVEEGVHQMAYTLEEPLIELGEAMQDHDYDRACDFLDRVKSAPETAALRENLAQLAFEERDFPVAERCYAALGNVAKASSLRRIRTMAADIAKEFGGDGFDHFEVQAELCLLNKEPKRAEQIFIENGQVDKALDMWDSLLRYDEAVKLADSRKHEGSADRRSRYYHWLVESKQEEQAAELKEQEGKYADAINLYLKGGVPARAAHVVATYGPKVEQQVLDAIASALFRAEIYEKAGDFFEKLKKDDRAIEAYKKGHVYRRAVELARRSFPDQVKDLQEAWGDYYSSQKQVDQAINHYSDAKCHAKAVKAAITARLWKKAVEILETEMVGSSENDTTVQNAYKQIALYYEEVNQLSEAEKYFVRAKSVEDAVQMYQRRNQTDHMLRVAQKHLDASQITALFVDIAQSLENKGDYTNAERIYLKVNQVDHAIDMYKKSRDFGSAVRLVASYSPEHLHQFHIALAQQFQSEGNYRMAEQHCISGRDWKRAVDMYRQINMWDEAIRVAKIHGGADEAKTVLVQRAFEIEAEEAVKLLSKYGMIDAAIDAATGLEYENFEMAIKWARISAPGKVAGVFIKWAMYHEDRGSFPQAEDCFVRGGKPREAIDMYIHEGMLPQAMKVAELHDPGAIPMVCHARGRAAFEKGDYKQAEELLLKGNSPEVLVRLYRDNKMLRDAQRVAQEYTPELVGDITREMGLDDKDPLSAGRLLEQSGEYGLAIEAYLRCGPEHSDDINALVQLWQRAVKLAMQYNRSVLKETSRAAVQKMVNAERHEDAARALEDIEDYRGAITLYVRAKKYDEAETLASRISPELVDYVKRARAQYMMESGGGAEGEIKAAVASGDWDKALKIARQSGPEQARIYASMYIQSVLVKERNVAKALEVIARDGMETGDLRFFKTFTTLVNLTIAQLPNSEWDLQILHDGFYKVVETMKNTGQPEEELVKAQNALAVLHAYTMQQNFRRLEMPKQAAWIMLTLPRYIPSIPADKAFFDAASAAREAEMLGVAFHFTNRFLEIDDQIEEGAKDSSGMDHGIFETMDYPLEFPLPPQHTVDPAAQKEARSWLLSKSLESGFDRSMPMVTDPNSNEPMFAAQLRSASASAEEASLESCAVTGLPLLPGEPKTRCKGCQRPANRDAWNKLVAMSKCCPWCRTNASVVLQ